ncbi:hypothetical protein BASA82_000935 [Batrachochytrium salamandrivorans]|nr:hypothetical protein BASA82_000935 [Batrachochytrium salamandrivorans]
MYVFGSALTWNDTQIQEVLALLVIQTNPDIPNYLNTPKRNKPRTAHTIQDPQHQYYTIIRMKLAIASTTILFAMMAAQAAVLSVAPATDVNLVKRTPNGDGDDEQSDMAGQSSSDPTSQFPMAGQSSSDPTPQDSMDDQSSSGPTPQLPLTKDEEDQVKNLHELLYSELSELAREAGTKQKEIAELEERISKLEEECDWETPSACTNTNTEIAELEEKLVDLDAQLEAILKKYETKLEEQTDIKEAKRLEDHAYLRSQYF